MPVMESDRENVWVFHVTPSDSSVQPDPKLQAIEDHKSESRFGLETVLIELPKFTNYYQEISNCILWPALHNIYRNVLINKETGLALDDYRKVNRMFAQKINDLDRTENDFIWIHDYHLLFVGKYLRELEYPEIIQDKVKPMKLGFFLHTPFEFPENLSEKLAEILQENVSENSGGLPVELPEGVKANLEELTNEIIFGILSFDKVGFQTNKDRINFIELAKTRFYIQITPRYNDNIFNVFADGITPINGCNLGVYPASIETRYFLNLVEKKSVQKSAEDFKIDTMKNSLEGGKLFFSVERFDYTKGILEKLEAYERYLERYPDRIGKDVFYQLAPLNRQKIHTYSRYQSACREKVLKINQDYGENYERADGRKIMKGYKAIDIRTDGMKRELLVLRYLAMDVGIVTPVKDGMNLVAKEMILSNPDAALILSEGAGTHHQFLENGLGGKYHLVILYLNRFKVNTNW
uniref:Trehalose-6-phosphate synthase n=1 Tax=Meloidogyne incognita TaxID=6306 RepID=A0A914LD81_MELIC